MDSAHKYLVIGLYEEDRLICGCAHLAWKKQSETMFPELIALMETAGWTSDDIDEVVITDGPGSYTGVRIAMSVAKVLCTRKHIPLYTISTLQLYAGVHEDSFVIMDARSSRAYTGRLHKGVFCEPISIRTLDEIKAWLKDRQLQYFGDFDLLEMKAKEPDFLEHFIALRPYYKKVEHIHTLTPRYFKDSNAYKGN